MYCRLCIARVRNQSHRVWQLTVRKRAKIWTAGFWYLTSLNTAVIISDRVMNAAARHQQHRKIRPWPDAISTPRSTLAGRPTVHHVQAVSAGVQVFT